MTANDFFNYPVCHETTFATVTYDVKINVFPRKEKKIVQRRESIISLSHRSRSEIK